MIETRNPGDMEVYSYGFYVFIESNVVTSNKCMAQILICNDRVELYSGKFGTPCILIRANL